jgi:hypothetical protein
MAGHLVLCRKVAVLGFGSARKEDRGEDACEAYTRPGTGKPAPAMHLFACIIINTSLVSSVPKASHPYMAIYRIH